MNESDLPDKLPERLPVDPRGDLPKDLPDNPSPDAADPSGLLACFCYDESGQCYYDSDLSKDWENYDDSDDGPRRPVPVDLIDTGDGLVLYDTAADGIDDTRADSIKRGIADRGPLKYNIMPLDDGDEGPSLTRYRFDAADRIKSVRHFFPRRPCRGTDKAE